jgi:cytochrome c oxidase subunit 2
VSAIAMMLDPKWEGQMPPSMSVNAPDTDWVYYAIYYFSIFFTVAITGAMLYFVWKYKRKKTDKLTTPTDFTKLEVFWTVAPIFFIVLLFHIGFKEYVKNAVPADGALEIRVHAKQWLWEFEYPNGMREVGVLRLPVDRPVKAIMSSDDVLHSFYIPEFRMKKDAVPGMYTTVVFEPNKVGEAHVFCAEYCGTSHSAMLAEVKILSQKDFDDYMKEGPANPDCKDPKAPCPEPMKAKWGEALFVQNGCPTCHARDGVTVSPAPNLKGKFGHMELLMTGPETMIDENYIKESIRKPQAKIVKGYTNVVMPTFTLSDRQVEALISYIKSLK